MADDEDPIKECEELFTLASELEELEAPTNDQIEEAAETFAEAAKCFDRNGDRVRSAKCFALAGEFFLVIDDRDRAAEYYGKAVLRSLMINDLESAKIIIDKGDEYSSEFDTFHFRMARDAFTRQMNEEIDALEQIGGPMFLGDDDDDDLDLYEEEEQVSPFDFELEEVDTGATNRPLLDVKDTLGASGTIVTQVKGFNVSTAEADSIEGKMSEYLAQSLIRSTRTRPKKVVRSTGVARTTSGFNKDLSSVMKVVRKDLYTPPSEIPDLDSSLDLTSGGFDDSLENLDDMSFDDEGSELGSDSLGDFEEGIDDIDPLVRLLKEDVDAEVVLESEFVSVSEVSAFDEDLEDVEIRDSIPYSWQVLRFDNEDEFELLSQDIDADSGSLIFTWKKSRLKQGETARIQYVLRRRLFRTLVAQTESQVFLFNSYHSIKEEDEGAVQVAIEFENTQEVMLKHVSIEDVVPDELRVVGFSVVEGRPTKPLPYLTRDGLTYRWNFYDVPAGSKIVVKYDLDERPFTRWFSKTYELDGSPKLMVEKIAEPIIQSLESEYLLFYEFNPDSGFSGESVVLRDEIPLNAEVVASYPVWLRPSIEVREDKRFMVWHNVELEGKIKRVCVRLKVPSYYNPLEPALTFVRYEVLADTEKKRNERDEEPIDLRRKMGLAVMKK